MIDRVPSTAKDGDGERRTPVDTFLQYWTVTIFLPSLLLALVILIMIIRATDKG